MGGHITNTDDATNGREYLHYRVIKLDASGNKVWDKTLGSNGIDRLVALVTTPDGGYLLGGSSDSDDISGDKSEANKGGSDYWVIKIDASGNKVWDKTLGGNKNDYLTALVATPDGGYLLGGNSNSDISGDKSESHRGAPVEPSYNIPDYWIVKIDASGQKIWDKTYGGSGYDNLNALLTTTNGDYLLGGTSGSSIGEDKQENRKGLEDFWVIKIKEKMPEVNAWDMRYGGAGLDNFTSVIKTSDGGYLAGGYTNSGVSGDKSQAGCGRSDYWMI